MPDRICPEARTLGPNQTGLEGHHWISLIAGSFLEQSFSNSNETAAICMYSGSNIFGFSGFYVLFSTANSQKPVHAASQAFNLNPGFGATKYLAQQPFLPDALGQDVMGFQHSLNDFTTQRISDLSQSEGLSQSSSQYPNITGTPSTNFQCTTDGCNKIFTGKGAKIAYNRHINSHKRPYPCPESSCNRHTHGFSRKDNLKNHIDRLHPMTTQKPLEHHTTNRTTKLRQNHGFRKLDADSSLSLELLKAKVYRIESMARNLKKMCGSILSMIEDSDEDNRMADMSSEDEGEDVEE